MGTFCVRRDMPSDSVTGVLSVESNCSSDSTDSDKAKPLLERKSVQPKAKKSFSRATADSASSVTSPSPDGRVSTEPINLNPSMNAAMKQRFNQQMNGKAASTSASCSTSSEATTNGVASDAHLTNGMDCSSSNDVSDEDIVMVSQKRRSEVTQESVRIKRSKLHTDDKGTSTTDIGQLNMQALVAKKIREDASSALLLRLRTNCGCHTKLTKLEAEVEQWKQRASNLQETTERLTKQMQELMETKKQRASVKVQADHHDIGETLQKMPPSTTPRASSAALTNGINRASTCQTLPMVPHQPHPISAGFSSAAASSSASQDHNRAAVYSPPKKKVPQAVVQPAPSLAAVPFALAPAANSRSTARASAGGASYNGAITHGGNVAQMQNQQQQQPQSRAVKPPSSAATVNARAAVANSISNLANNSARAPTANTVPPGNRPAFQQNPQSQNSNSATQRGRQSNHPPAATNNTPQASNQINSSISSTPAGGTAATCRKSTAQLNTNVRAYAPASGSPPHNPQPLRTSVRPAGPVVPSVLIDLTADDDEPMIVAENIVTAPVNNNNAPNAGATFQGTLGATNVVTHTSAYASPMAASTPLPQNNNNNSNIPPPSYQAAQPPSQAIRQMASVGHFNPSSTSGTTSSGLNNNMTPLSLPMPPLIRGFTPAATAVVGAANGGGGGSASTADVTVSYAFVDVYDPTFRQPMKHSPPMPIDTSGPNVAAVKPLSLPGPPGPRLTVNPFDGQGIRLKWDMDVPAGMTIDKYEIFAKQNDSDQPNSIGTVTALPLPMACTLTQFHVGDRYLFQVRALDSDGNWGPMSAPADISI